jgi:signal transduction histidine kinase
VATTVSVREGAGLYLVRRARTLTAPHQLRLLVTAFVALLVVDLGRIHLGRLEAGDPVRWASAGGEVLSYLAIALVLWRPVAGLVLAGFALVAGLAVGGTATEPALLLVMGALVGWRGERRTTRAFVIGVLGYLVLAASLNATHMVFVLGWFGGAAAIGLAGGLLGLRLGRHRNREGRQLAEVATEDSRLRSDERRLLARELHDVVTHQLSNVSLQVMSHLDSTDAEELRGVLRRVNRATDSALTELRLLVRVLRDDPATAAGIDELGELSRRVPPTAAAAAWARRLVEAGFDPAIEVPAKADRLEMTTQRTVTRALEVTFDNILRNAPPRSRCTVDVTVNGTQVVVRATNPVQAPGRKKAAGLGWGLRGLRERVDLTGGGFSAGLTAAGPGEPEWVVVVTLPLS